MKNRFFNLALISFCIPQFASGMQNNDQQLQLQAGIKPRALPVDCSIMINDHKKTVMYAMKAFHDAIFEHSNLPSTIQDPIMIFRVKQKSTHNEWLLPLPAKYLVNFDDKSMLQIYETDGSQLIKNDPTFKNKLLLINAVCKKNPKLNGNSFIEQFNNAMNEFYENPGSPWVGKENQEELFDAGIVTKTIRPATSLTPILVLGQHGPQLVFGTQKKATFEHGPNGCPNEKLFIETITTSHTKSYNNSMFKFVTGRQYGNRVFTK